MMDPNQRDYDTVWTLQPWNLFRKLNSKKRLWRICRAVCRGEALNHNYIYGRKNKMRAEFVFRVFDKHMNQFIHVLNQCSPEKRRAIPKGFKTTSIGIWDMYLLSLSSMCWVFRSNLQSCRKAIEPSSLTARNLRIGRKSRLCGTKWSPSWKNSEIISMRRWKIDWMSLWKITSWKPKISESWSTRLRYICSITKASFTAWWNHWKRKLSKLKKLPIPLFLLAAAFGTWKRLSSSLTAFRVCTPVIQVDKMTIRLTKSRF